MMLTLLISGPKQPGNDIDVYLEPLIDDLKSLWDGIGGTINDFPAYGNLSGCVVKGYKACPICGDDTPSHKLKNGYKICYIGHRKWLPINHPYRRQHVAFNGKPEYGTPPEPLIGEEVLHMVEDGDRVCWKKTVDVSKLDKLGEDVVVTLCLLEKYFPPSFFDIMNRTRPEDCIAERYIAEEAIEFCTKHLSDVSTVGVPSSQKMGVSKPLSGCTVSVVDRDLLNQAHLYVLENTEEVLPYIEQHMIHIKTAYPKFRKRTKWLQDKHNSTFIHWLLFKVQSELNEEDNHGVSENLRWLAAGPNMAVPSYRSYLIKGIKFNIKAQDDVRTTQNSGVYLLAHTMQVASAKDKNPIISNMGFYGVIQEIWDLDYQKFTIPVFRCDWIDSTSGLVVDELGFTLVDLSKIGHRNDQFVLASQVKQVFFVDDPMHRGWLIVLSMPNREYNDVIGDDDVLGDVRIECEPFTRGMPNVDTFDELVGEFGSQNIRDRCEDMWIE
ncbi:unnamed protein product [Prunus armeniaca]